MWEWKPLMHYDNILHTCLTVAFNTSDDCSLHNAYNEQLLITACVMHCTQHIVNVCRQSVTVHCTCTITLTTTILHDKQHNIQTLVTVVLSVHISGWRYCYMRFCPSVCLSHCWSIPEQFKILKYVSITWKNNVCSFLTSNFIAVSYRGSYLMSELNRVSPCQKQ